MDEVEACTAYAPEVDVMDLSGVDTSEDDQQWPMKFQMTVMNNEEQEGRELWGTVDGGAMLCVLNSTIWAQVEHLFGSLLHLQVVCWMANGMRVSSWGT
ncbi:hypothetical protein FRC11_010616, partial [Ceratobasidium sp. 423]